MRVAIVGTGYVGLVTGACLASAGHAVTCIDADCERAARVARGECPIFEDGLAELVKAGADSCHLTATDDLGAGLAGAEVIMICVGTPSTDGAIDLTGVESAAGQVGAALRRAAAFPVVAVKSTVVPGTTAGCVRRAVEMASGLRAGENFGLAMNPEFLSQGSAVRDFLAPDRIVVGEWDRRSGEILERLYAPFPAPVLRLGLGEAEMVKYTANGLQATLISYANQIAALCEAIPGIDHARVMGAVHLDRALDGPAGGRAGAVQFLMGGLGFGGSCFPKDLEALAAFATAKGVDAPLVRAVSQVNTGRVEAMAGLLEHALGGLDGRTVTVLGLAFKPGTDDLRESPGVKLAHRLVERGAVVRLHDPLPVVRDRLRTRYPETMVADSAEAALAGADAAAIATAWADYRAWDWAALAVRMRSPVILDSRRALAGLDLPRWLRVLRAGVCPTTDSDRENA